MGGARSRDVREVGPRARHVARRSQVGNVLVFDPAAATGLERATWTPLASCGDWQAARRTAERLAKAAQGAPRSGQDAEFWSQAGARFLAPLLLAAALTDRSMGDVTRWIDAEDHEEVLEALEDPEHEVARNARIAAQHAEADRTGVPAPKVVNVAAERLRPDELRGVWYPRVVPRARCGSAQPHP